MITKRHIQWLYDQLPELVEKGVLSQENAGRIHDHYGEVAVFPKSRIAMLMMAILGAAFVGSGIILLLAHNWDDLSRPIRAVLSFTPLVVGQALGLWVLLKRAESAAWREGIAMFITAAIGVCISLIAQTYNLPGDMATFLLTWCLLGLPLIYVFNASGAAFLYLVGITSWAGYQEAHSNNAFGFWLLLALALPHIGWAWRTAPKGPRFAFLTSVLGVVLCIAPGLVLDKSFHGIWIVVYTSLFALLYFVGSELVRSCGGGRPLRTVGACGTIVMALALTYDGAWRSIGWPHYYGRGLTNVAVLHDFALALVLVAGMVALAVRAVRMGNAHRLVWIGAALLGVVCFAVANFVPGGDVAETVPVVAFNVYLFVLGVFLIGLGARREQLGLMNFGLATLSILLILRFFDADITFVLRGIAFIAVGAGFLIFNFIASRRLNRQGREIQ